MGQCQRGNNSRCVRVCDLSNCGKLSSVRAVDTEIPPGPTASGLDFAYAITICHQRNLESISIYFYFLAGFFYGYVRIYDGELKW